MSFSEKIKDEILSEKIKKCCEGPLRYGELITESKEISILELNKIIKKSCCRKSFLKGAFLGSGCIVNPNTDYHFEISVKTKSYAKILIDLLEEYALKAKVIKRNSNYVVYIKDSEKIATLIAILGANKAMFEYENIRVEKSIKNDINRTVNCETANLTKVIETAYKQINAIQKIKNAGKYDELNSNLKEVCNLRLKYNEASIEELSKLSSTNISKSGMYHRLKKIEKLAEEL